MVFERTQVLPQMFIYFNGEMSEMRRPIGTKFCMVIRPKPNFIMRVQNFGGTPQQNFRGQKYAKFDPISYNFKVRWRISP